MCGIACFTGEHDIADANHDRLPEEHRLLAVLFDEHVRLTVDRNDNVRSKTNNQHNDNEKEDFYFEAILQNN